MIKQTIKSFAIALLGGAVAVGAYDYFKPAPKAYVVENVKSSTPAQFASYSGPAPASIDFTMAAEKSLNAVVHIKTQVKVETGYGRDPFYEYFFGPHGGGNSGMAEASGSGVIIRGDGYIVTNNHVIDNASKISVTLNNKKSYEAKLIGTDPSTDIAVLKIESSGLPYVEFGNSDEVRIGEWVLAVGNPFNLTSTVTAGIVSAKGRNINILKGDKAKNVFPIESFIQTDAAVNPGNSGGALVNTQGQLVGINTAIASNTGSYSGYSFAVPVNIVKKVSTDLIETGVVQRAFLGVNIQDIDQTLADELKLEDNNGVYVAGMVEGGAAENSGLKKGDIIMSVGSVDVNNAPELQEQVGKYKPGQAIDIRVKRGAEQLIVPVTLRNAEGNTAKVEKSKIDVKSSLGATFTTATAEELKKLDVESGVKITSISNGKLAQLGVKKGFIITKVDDEPVSTPDELIDILESKKGGVLLEGVYPNGTKAYYGFGM
ncbi:MAG TPA: Do family serine endopeptidase [Flavobacteriales bacterium]|nr:Do family serine endopeptidase [Flavobacteriales bacterium]